MMLNNSFCKLWFFWSIAFIISLGSAADFLGFPEKLAVLLANIDSCPLFYLQLITSLLESKISYLIIEIEQLPHSFFIYCVFINDIIFIRNKHRILVKPPT